MAVDNELFELLDLTLERGAAEYCKNLTLVQQERSLRHHTLACPTSFVKAQRN